MTRHTHQGEPVSSRDWRFLIFVALSFLALILGPFAVRAELRIEDFRKFNWILQGKGSTNFPESATAYGRDFNDLQDWVNQSPQNKALIQKRRAAGKKVICYMNIGRLQAGADRYHGVYKHFGPLANSTCASKDGWGEPWVNWRKDNHERALKAYDRAFGEVEKSKLCDAIEFDNTDVFDHYPSGKCGSRDEVLGMLKSLCGAVKSHKMDCIAKNTFDHAQVMSNVFDAVIAEECFTTQSTVKTPHGSKDLSNALILSQTYAQKGKPVICMEYMHKDVEGGGYKLNRFAQDCALANKYRFASFVVESRQSTQGEIVEACSIKSSAERLTNTSLPEAQKQPQSWQ